MRIFSFLVLFCSFGLLAQQPMNVTAVGMSSESEQLTLKMAEAKSLHANFKQTKVMTMMDSQSESHGEIYYKAPDLIKWIYRKPFPYSLLFKNSHLYINDDGKKSVQDLRGNKMFEKLGKLISGSLNGELLKDTENFNITYSKTNKGITAEMIPKDKNLADMFQKVIMCFSSEKMLQSVKLLEKSGDFTLIRFADWRINNPINPTVFQQ